MRRRKHHFSGYTQGATETSAASANATLLQRKGSASGSSQLAGELQKRVAGNSNDSSVPASVGEVMSSPGKPLDAAIRATMEPRFGHDFSRVRVHTDNRAAESAAAVNAGAYTVGQHIVFADTAFDPRSSEGSKLLAHELTHVVQQATRMSSTAGLRIGNSTDPAESEARGAAARITSSNSMPRAMVRPAGGVLQRDDPKTTQQRIDVALVLDGDSNSMAEAAARAGTVLRVTSVEDAKKQLQALGKPIGTLFVISHANRAGEVEFFSEIGTISWVKISDLGSGLKGALPSDQAPLTVDFRGCKVGEAGSELESIRQDLGATEAQATNCWTFTQEATPFSIDGVEMTKESDIPEGQQALFDKGLLQHVDGMVAENGHKVKDCLIGLGPKQHANKKNLKRIKELYFRNQGILVASWASPEFNKNWQKGSICSQNMTAKSKPCGMVKKTAPK